MGSPSPLNDLVEGGLHALADSLQGLEGLELNEGVADSVLPAIGGGGRGHVVELQFGGVPLNVLVHVGEEGVVAGGGAVGGDGWMDRGKNCVNLAHKIA